MLSVPTIIIGRTKLVSSSIEEADFEEIEAGVIHPKSDAPEGNYPTLAHIGLLCLAMVGITFFTSGVVAVLSVVLRTNLIKSSIIIE